MNRSSPVPRWRPVLLATLSIALAGRATAQQAETGCTRDGCHGEYRRAAFLHEPVADGDCTACHVPRQDSQGLPPVHEGEARAGFEPPRGGEACGECHEPVPVFHDPGADSDLDPCLRCHDPHGGESAASLRGPEAELCLACHAGEFEAPRPRRMPREARLRQESRQPEEPEIHRHGPIEQGRCSPCHPAHGASPAELLRGELPAGLYAPYSRPAYSACYGSCHSPELVEQERTTEATGFRNGDDNLHYRHVVRQRRGRSCRLCHAPHLASNRALIQGEMPFGRERLTLAFEPTRRGGRCTTSCHIPIEYDREEAIPSRMRTP